MTYAFMNTVDGYKLLYADGVFCEFAVFEEAELAHIPFAPGRVVWKADGVDEAIAVPIYRSGERERPSTSYLLGEALTNLYVGLLREQRGERLSALRFIQGHAVDRIVELAARLQEATNAHADPFNADRRFEQRYPNMAQILPALLQGYNKNRESALAALTFLDEHFAINAGMKTAVRQLCNTHH